MNGIKTFNPGSRIRLNLPILSTIHASCCGTNIITVFNGVVDRYLMPEYRSGYCKCIKYDIINSNFEQCHNLRCHKRNKKLAAHKYTSINIFIKRQIETTI